MEACGLSLIMIYSGWSCCGYHPDTLSLTTMEFCKVYQNLFTNISDNIASVLRLNQHPHQSIYKNHVEEMKTWSPFLLFRWLEITMKEIKNMIKKLHSSSSTGAPSRACSQPQRSWGGRRCLFRVRWWWWSWWWWLCWCWWQCWSWCWSQLHWPLKLSPWLQSLLQVSHQSAPACL